MKIQCYGYFHTLGSIPIVASNWIKVLAKYHDVKVFDYYGEGNRFESIAQYMGTHEGKAPAGIFFGYPSIMKKSGLLANKHNYKIGVFTTEAKISSLEKSYLDQIQWNRIYVPSEYCKSMYSMSNYSRKIVVAQHGVSDAFMQKPDPEPAKLNPFTFLYVFQNSETGGSVLRKNVLHLLDAFKIVKKNHDCRMTIKTSSTLPLDIPSIEKEYPGVSVSIRHFPLREMNLFYRTHHAYVNPTKAEGFGMTPLEAMACGIPVVSVIHSGMTEFLNEGNCVPIKYQQGTIKDTFRFATNDGIIFKVEAQDIANAMIDCITNYEKHLQIAKGNAEFVKGNYSWEKVLSVVLESLRQMG